MSSSTATLPARLGYQPALDGLRAVAVGMVVLHHLESPGSSAFFVRGAANIGVDVFFVISGFLITRLMIDEYFANDRISLVEFWKRRALRLLPLAVSVIGAVWLIDRVWSDAFFRSGAAVSSTRSAIAALTYHMNIMMMFDSTRQEWALTHTWSLSIEEQFYLVWPVVVVAVFWIGRRSPVRALLTASMLIVIVSSALRFIMWDDPDRVYNSIESRAGQLCAGCALAALAVLAPRLVARIGRLGPLAVMAIVGIGLTYNITFGWNSFGYDVVALLAVVAVAGSIDLPAGWYLTVASSPVAVWLGTRSYAIYLIHYPVFLMITPARLDALPTPLMWAVRVVVALLVSELAHRCIEKPVAGLRKRLSAANVRADSPAPVG